MPVNAQNIKPVTSLTSGAGIATTLNQVIERSNLAVVIVNQNEKNIGDMSTLKSDDKSSLVNAFNELTSRLEDGDLISVYVGLLQDLNTQNKTNVVAAINEINNSVGPLSLLEIDNVTNLVSAINYLNTVVGQLADIGDGDFTNLIDFINSKVAKDGDTMKGELVFDNSDVISSIFSGGANVSSASENSFEIKTSGGVGLYPTTSGGPIALGQASHYFNVVNGDFTNRGILKVEKDIEGFQNFLLRGTRMAFVNATGTPTASINLAGTNLSFRTGSSSGPQFRMEVDQLRLPAEPTGTDSATTKNYVDTSIQTEKTFSDNTYFKKAGGTITGATTINEKLTVLKDVEATGNSLLRQGVPNSNAAYRFLKNEDGSILGSVFYDSASNTVRIESATSTGTPSRFAFLSDGNLNLINSVGPTADTHASTKKYVDDRIAFVRQRPNQTGTQTMSTISDAGALATKNKIVAADVDATGTPSLTTAFFGDNTWKTVDLDTSKYVRNNLAAAQNVLGTLGVVGGLIVNTSGTNGVLTFNTSGTVKGRIRWDETASSLTISNGANDMVLASTGALSLPGALSVSAGISGTTLTLSGALTATGAITSSGVGTVSDTMWVRAIGAGGIPSLNFAESTGVERARIEAAVNKSLHFRTNSFLWQFDQSGVTVLPGNLYLSGGSISTSSAATTKIDLNETAKSITLSYGTTAKTVAFSGNGDVLGKNGANNIWSIDGTSGAFWSAGDMTALSDKRVKTNIRYIDNALDIVNALKGVTFEKKNNLGEIKYGFIAQDVQKVVPELVKDNGEYLSVDATHGFEAILVEAVKELSAQVRDLKAEIDIMRRMS